MLKACSLLAAMMHLPPSVDALWVNTAFHVKCLYADIYCIFAYVWPLIWSFHLLLSRKLLVSLPIMHESVF